MATMRAQVTTLRFNRPKANGDIAGSRHDYPKPSITRSSIVTICAAHSQPFMAVRSSSLLRFKPQLSGASSTGRQ